MLELGEGIGITLHAYENTTTNQAGCIPFEYKDQIFTVHHHILDTVFMPCELHHFTITISFLLHYSIADICKTKKKKMEVLAVHGKTCTNYVVLM